MVDTPKELGYRETHEWVRNEGDGTVTVGITDYAQDSLGDIVYVELPELGDELDLGQEAGVVESVKAASDVFAPLTGTVIAINEALEDTPEIINASPYGDGWFYRLRLADPAELDDLLDAEAYLDVVEEEQDSDD
ncbi:MAG: glycine cleavage system protein GcvH [Gammaproteobacteria bacterium]|nr:glycine cleavage system protein GcvH [Gammaproteobacteria bacterium]MBK9428746.1 glycine cleavage system protein GcvH [Gammaproteobacteria bacterium]